MLICVVVFRLVHLLLLESGGLSIVGAKFFQAGEEAGGGYHDHEQTVAITTARGGPHGLAVAASPYCASPVLWATDTTGGPW